MTRPKQADLPPAEHTAGRMYAGMVLSAGEVVIVSGPPGAGKSTIAAMLAEQVERGVHLESDWFYRWIRSGFVPPHLPASRAQNTTVMDLVSDTAAGYAQAGYAVVWDGVVGPWWIERISQRLAAHRVPVRYLLLRAARDTSLQRIRDRDGDNERSGAAVMWDLFSDLGGFEAHLIDSDGPLLEVLDRCRAALHDGGLRIDASNQQPAP